MESTVVEAINDAEASGWAKFQTASGTPMVVATQSELDAILDQQKAQGASEALSAPNTLTAAIEFAVNETSSSGIDFLRAWNEGAVEEIREGWPDAPEAVFIGADPLFKAGG